MIVRTFSAAALATAALISMGSIASAQQVGSDAAFSAQLDEANAASRNRLSGSLGREERQTAEHHLRIAEDLYRRGRTAQARGYLNFARGQLGLPNNGGAAQTVSR